MTARAVMNRLRREGWAEGPGKGKQVIFTNLDHSRPIVVAWHDGDMPMGALRSICQAASWEFPPHR
jgi:predicted RNA binding protein YcfA (HicA-like mRNA interferase family)